MPRNILLAIALFLVVPWIASAQSPRLDITVSPVSLDLTGQPGTEIHDKIRVHNNTNDVLHLQVQIKKITPADQDPGFQLADPTPQDDFISWIHVDTPTFDAPSKEWVYVPFTISIPSTAAFGYYPVFVIQQDVQKSGVTKTAELSGGAAIIASLNVLSPNAHVEAQLVDFKASHHLAEYLPVDFSVMIHNAGNIHVRPRGNIFISSGNKKDIAILEVNPDLSTIIPNSSRSFTAKWTDGFITREKSDQGVYQLVFHWDAVTHMRIGKYSARLLLVYDAGQRDATLEAVTTFWVFPWKLIGIIILVPIISIVGIWMIIRLYVRRLMRKQNESKR